MMDAAPPPPLRPRRPSPALAAFLGWVVPGLGHAYVGRPGKGLFLFTVILAAYGLGLVLADFRCVSWERDPFWFAAQGVAAGPTALVAWLTRNLPMDRRVPTFDVGLLYVSVASLLNAVAVADALGIVDEQCALADAQDRENARVEAELRAAAEAAALADAAASAPTAGPPPETPLGSEPDVSSPHPPPEPPPLLPPHPPSPPRDVPPFPRTDVPDFGSPS